METPTPLLPHLAGVAKEARAQAGAQPHNVAHEANVNPSTVVRFEKLRGGWPTKTDELIAGYAKVSGTAAALIWAEALNRWSQAQDADAPPESLPGLPRARKPPARAKTRRAG